MTSAPRQLRLVELGVVRYEDGLRLQQEWRTGVVNGNSPDTLLQLEHPHVYTLGRRGESKDVLASDAQLRRLDAEVHHVDRGGEATYHGPGQLVAYPIIDLRRWGGGPLKYVRSLERVIIDTLAEFGISAESEGHPTGVWVEDRKIAAIGVKVARRVTTHGFALNVSTDLSYFEHIVPCGMPGVEVTSVSRELGRAVDVDEVVRPIVENFTRVFGFRLEGTRTDNTELAIVDTLKD